MIPKATYLVEYLVRIEGHPEPVGRVFNTGARRALTAREIVSRARRHAARNAGEFVGSVKWNRDM